MRPCKYCKGWVKDVIVRKSPLMHNVDKALILQNKDKHSIVLMWKNVACGLFDINYCPMCGGKLEVEK